MRDFNRGGNRDGRGYGGRSSQRRSYGGGGDFGRREMHHATCAQCGRDCEVPFRPREDRPVYCSDCFEKRKNEDGNSRRSYLGSEKGNRGGDGGQLSEQIKILNTKLDKIISFLEPKVETSLVVKDEVTDIVLKPKTIKAKTKKKKAEAEEVK